MYFPQNFFYYMKRILFLFVVLCISQILYSQSDLREGFIIRQNQDTVRGIIKYKGGNTNPRDCQFKALEQQSIIAYKADDIIGYGFKNDKYFESRKVETSDQNSEFVFLEVLISGKVSLFKYDNVFYIEKAESGLLKLSSETIETIINGVPTAIKSSSYQRTLTLLLSDCPEMSSLIPVSNFSERSLTKLLERYNICMKAPAVIYKNNKSWIHTRFGISGGYISSHIAFETKNNFMNHLGPFERSNSPIVGVSFELLAPRLNERVSFLADFLFSKSKYDSDNIKYAFSNAQITKNFVNIEMTHLKIPIGLRYTFQGKGLSTFFNFGLSETRTLNSVSEWTQTVEYINLFDTYQKEALKIRKNQLGIWGGVGISRVLGKGLKAYVELRYENSQGINAEEFLSIVKSNVTSFQYIIGLTTK